MITELKPGKYKLIDKEGYFDEHPLNTEIYYSSFEEDVVEVERVNNYGEGSGGNDDIFISTREYKFFEPYEEPTEEPVIPEPHYWDGKEDLEVGMVVDYYGVEEETVAIRGEEVCITFNAHLSMTNIHNINPVKRTPTLEEKQRKLL